jgi:hypothetical protein
VAAASHGGYLYVQVVFCRVEMRIFVLHKQSPHHRVIASSCERLRLQWNASYD